MATQSTQLVKPLFGSAPFGASQPPTYPPDVQRKIDFVAALSKYDVSPAFPQSAIFPLFIAGANNSRQLTPAGQYSDFKIVCGSKEYSVHRIIIASHSKYFKRLCESDFKEAGERKVVLQDDPDAAVLAMIRYMYAFDYFIGRRENALCLHSWVFTIADKYDIPGLKALAFEKFSSLSFVYRTGGFSIGPSSEIRAAQLLEVVSHTYSHAPPSDDRLKVLVVERFMMEDKKLLRPCKKDAFNKVLLEVPEFACDLIPALSGFEMGRSDANADGQGQGGM